MAKAKRRSAQASRRSVQGAQQRVPIREEREELAAEPMDIDEPAQPVVGAEPALQRKQERLQPRSTRGETSRAAARAATRESVNRTPKVSTRRRYQKKRSNSWLWIVFAAAVVAVIVVVFVIAGNQNQNQGGSSSATGTKPTDPTVLKAVTTVDTSILDTVNTGGLQNPIVATKNNPAKLTGPNGKPEFFYDGAEYCPYCAAERWSTAVTLSRFGTFTKLPETSSSSSDVFPNTSTLSFYGSSYSSSYVDFVPVEETTNQKDSSGNYPLLQTPTADQANIIKTYNGPPYSTSTGGIPFVSIANQYLELGPAFSPDVLSGLSQQAIAAKLTDPNDTVTKDILGGANYMTAAICAVTNNQPASVCTTGAIPQIEKSLPKPTAAIPGSSTQTVLAAEQGALIKRRED